MNHLLLLAAIILFILAALAFFLIDAWTLRTDLGLTAVGLACFAAAHLPLAEVVKRA
jgi:hypothetical protein